MLGLGNSLKAGDAIVFPNKYSISLDGINDYVNCGNGSALSMSGDQALTISAWVKPTDISGGEIIVSFGSDTASGGGKRVALYMINATVQLAFWNADISVGSISAGAWSHLVVTYAGGNRNTTNCKGYINGQAQTVSGGTEAALDLDDMDFFNIGSDHQPGQPYAGLIDEVAVWNTDLAQADIDKVYNNGYASNIGAIQTSNLKAWYRSEDGTGSTLTDKSASANNGTMTNGATFSSDVPG